MTLAEAVETLKKCCLRQNIDCSGCPFYTPFKYKKQCEFKKPPEFWETPTETNLYDEEEIHENCTVQILRNSVTGEESVGWWIN